jgi:membrane protein required for colicin V production
VALNYQTLVTAVSAGQLVWVDYFIIGVMIVSSLIGLFRGFVKEVFALVLWIAAMAIGWHFCRDVATLFQTTINYPSARMAIAFLLLFFGTLMIGSFFSFLLSLIIESTGLTGTDRLFGMVFGIARGAMVVAVLVLLAGLTPLPEDPWWKQSLLIPPFQALAVWLKTHIPSALTAYLNYH